MASIYDLVYDRNDDIPFYLEYCKQYGAPVLELCAGTGRLTIPIAREGYDITGLDLSKNMLNVCRKKLAKERPEVRKHITLIKGDMREFSLNGKFRIVLIPFTSFLHNTTVEDQVSTIHCVWKHLSDNGLLILEIFNPGIGRPENIVWLDHVGEIGRGRTIMRMSTYQSDKENHVSNSTIIYDIVSRKGTINRKIVQFKLRPLSKNELVSLLEQNGFAVMALYGSISKKTFSQTDSKNIVCVARKTSS
jgi:2-polyprenyl-3-methyl-5-hydroxy-6-metoxy-1,4-benzoquinol methylase